VKITLNDSIPEERRPQVEALVKNFANASEVLWRHSRFPRFVILVEPGSNDRSEPEAGSIFESPQTGKKSLASVATFLEDRIKLFLSGQPQGS
jgi:hypothetical protein